MTNEQWWIKTRDGFIELRADIEADKKRLTESYTKLIETWSELQAMAKDVDDQIRQIEERISRNAKTVEDQR